MGDFSNHGPSTKLVIVGFVALLILLQLLYVNVISFLVPNLFPIVLVSIILYAFFKLFIKKYTETERGIVFRFEAFSRVAGPGWSLVVPFFEREYDRVDIRTQTGGLSGITAVTRDDIPVKLDVSYFFAISDPMKAVLRVKDRDATVTNFVYGTVRDGIGEFLMRELFSRIEDINPEFRKRLTYAADEWGVDVKNVEIMKIILPDTIMSALSEPVTAEQKAIAARFNAEAKRVAIEVFGDASERLNPNALTYLYLKALGKMASGKGSKLILPMSFPSVTKSLGAGVGLGLGVKLGMEENEAIDKIVDKIAEK